MLADSYPRLLGDVGGTNARFAWRDRPDSPPRAVDTLRCADHATLHDAIRCYLERHALQAPRGGAIGIANPVTGDHIRMTNHHWAFSVSELGRSLGIEHFTVINDFTALALSLPGLDASELLQVGPGQPEAGASIAVIGPGTGLGVSGLVPTADGSYAPICGEGGHVTLAAANEREERVIARLRERFEHVSAERVLSGPGLVNLHDALARDSGSEARSLEPAQVLQNAATDPTCGAAVEMFCAFLGSVAGNLALTLGAQGGVFIGGGIVPRLADRLQASAFRERFEAKGRFRDYLARIPTLVIRSDVSPALLGASRALDALVATRHTR